LDEILLGDLQEILIDEDENGKREDSYILFQILAALENHLRSFPVMGLAVDERLTRILDDLMWSLSGENREQYRLTRAAAAVWWLTRAKKLGASWKVRDAIGRAAEAIGVSPRRLTNHIKYLNRGNGKKDTSDYERLTVWETRPPKLKIAKIIAEAHRIADEQAGISEAQRAEMHGLSLLNNL
jgi:hypothetical protein